MSQTKAIRTARSTARANTLKAMALLASIATLAACSGAGESFDPSYGGSGKGRGTYSGPKAKSDTTGIGITGTARSALAQGERAAAKQAVALLQSGKLTDALSIADGLTDPAYKAAVEWAAFRAAPRQVGFARYDAFLKANPGWPGTNWLRRRAEETLWREGYQSQAISAFFAGHQPLSTEGKLALAKVYMDNGQQSEAKRLIRDAWNDDVMSDEAEKRALEVFSGHVGREEYRARARRLALAEKFEVALLESRMAGNDYHTLIKAVVAVGRKQSQGGALLAQVPSSLRSDPAYLFAAAQLARRNDNLYDAVKYMNAAPADPEQLGSPDAWWVERRMLARRLMEQNEHRSAYTVARDAVGGTDQNQMDAQFHAGWVALRKLNDPATAARHFARVSEIAQTPISQARGAYWQGRAAEAAGSRGEATGYYERAARHATTYYGQLARNKLGQTDIPIRRTAPAHSDFASNTAARAMKHLYDLDGENYAYPLAIELSQRLSDAGQLAALAEYMRTQGDAKAELAIGKAATQRGFPLDDYAYTLRGIPNYTAVPNSAEKAMVYAIARQESAFDPQAVSSAGARGLMQMMPATAAKTARNQGIGWRGAGALTGDPAYNATLGSAHLQELMDEFGGSYIMTFAGYNAGSKRVYEWVKAYGDPRDPATDAVDWVENIPFSETRNYVQRVLENMMVYRARLGSGSTNTAEALKRGTRTAAPIAQNAD